MKVRFAVAPGGSAFDAPRFVDLVEQLEALGFDTLWLSDIPMGPSLDPIVAEVTVPVTPTEAFVGFTAQMGEWWDPALTPDAATFSNI